MKKYSLGFQSCKYIGDKLYFSSFVGNALFCYDKGRVEYLGKFPEEKQTYCIKLYFGIAEYLGKLFFAPQVANHIAVYDLKTKEFSRIELDSAWTKYRSKFGAALVRNHTLFMFPIMFDGIVSVDLETNNTEIYDEWVADVNHNVLAEKDAYCGFGIVTRGNRVFCPICKSNQVLEFDLDTRYSTIHSVGTEGHAAICDDGQYLWLLPRRGRDVIKWDPKTGKSEKVSILNENIICSSFVGAAYARDHVYAFPEYGNNALQIDVKTHKIKKITILSDICKANYNSYSIHDTAFVFAERHGNELIMSSGKTSEFIRMDLKTSKIKKERLNIPYQSEAYFERLYNEKFATIISPNWPRFSFEGNPYGLTEFIKYIGSGVDKKNTVDDFGEETCNENHLWSRAIWKAVV